MESPTLTNKTNLVLDMVVTLSPYYGLTDATLYRACEICGAYLCDFSDGILSAVSQIEERYNEMFMANFVAQSTSTRMRDHVQDATLQRIMMYCDNLGFLRALLAWGMIPWNAMRMSNMIYKAASCIWQATGDKSSDFNFYTKRTSLSAIYISTLYVLVNDNSKYFGETREFLSRQIGRILRFYILRKKILNIL